MTQPLLPAASGDPEQRMELPISDRALQLGYRPTQNQLLSIGLLDNSLTPIGVMLTSDRITGFREPLVLSLQMSTIGGQTIANWCHCKSTPSHSDRRSRGFRWVSALLNTFFVRGAREKSSLPAVSFLQMKYHAKRSISLRQTFNEHLNYVESTQEAESLKR